MNFLDSTKYAKTKLKKTLSPVGRTEPFNGGIRPLAFTKFFPVEEISFEMNLYKKCLVLLYRDNKISYLCILVSYWRT